MVQHKDALNTERTLGHVGTRSPQWLFNVPERNKIKHAKIKKQRNTNTGGQFVLSSLFRSTFHPQHHIKSNRDRNAIFKSHHSPYLFHLRYDLLDGLHCFYNLHPISTRRIQHTRCPNKTSNLHPLCFPIHDIPRLDSSTFKFFHLLSHRTTFGPPLSELLRTLRSIDSSVRMAACMNVRRSNMVPTSSTFFCFRVMSSFCFEVECAQIH